MFGNGAGRDIVAGVLWTQAEAQGAKKLTKEMIDNTAAIADAPVKDEYNEMMPENLNDRPRATKRFTGLKLPNSVDPASIFDPVVPG